jgi:hypothetical protein
MQWQFEAMLRWANHRAISMDAIFGTNHIKFHLFTLMVFDDFRNDVPIAWVITSRQKRRFNPMVYGVVCESDYSSTRMAFKLFYRWWCNLRTECYKVRNIPVRLFFCFHLFLFHLFGIYKQVYVLCTFVWRDKNVPIYLCT